MHQHLEAHCSETWPLRDSVHLIWNLDLIWGFDHLMSNTSGSLELRLFSQIDRMWRRLRALTFFFISSFFLLCVSFSLNLLSLSFLHSFSFLLFFLPTVCPTLPLFLFVLFSNFFSSLKIFLPSVFTSFLYFLPHLDFSLLVFFSLFQLCLLPFSFCLSFYDLFLPSLVIFSFLLFISPPSLFTSLNFHSYFLHFLTFSFFPILFCFFPSFSFSHFSFYIAFFLLPFFALFCPLLHCFICPSVSFPVTFSISSFLPSFLSTYTTFCFVLLYVVQFTWTLILVLTYSKLIREHFPSLFFHILVVLKACFPLSDVRGIKK